ncbi:MAG: ABC transporter permease [Verrucomicrobia bacterium]|nr:ABC transporter permease [Verrucomicrobiota bacterium]
MLAFFQDLRYAGRLFRNNPGFTAVAVVAIALGVATATTMFTFFNAILLKPNPWLADESRLVSVKTFLERDRGLDLPFSQPNFLDLRAQSHTLSGVFLHMDRTVILAGGPQPDRLLGSSISANGFQVLGVQPVLGRRFGADEEKDKAAPVALLSYGLWQRRFAGNAAVVGQHVVLNGEPVTIVGVMPEGFRFPEQTDLWLPLHYDHEEKERGGFAFPVWGRLAPGVTLAQAQAEMDVIAKRLVEAHPEINAGLGVRLVPMREEQTADVRRLLHLLVGAVIFVQLIACANVANLLLVKAAGRARELAVRAALGASGRRIVQQVLTESLLLGAVGGCLGVIGSLWGVDLVRASVPVELPYWLKFQTDWRVLLFAFVVVCGAGVLSGLLPAWQASRPDLNHDLKEGSRGATGGSTARRVRHGLVIGQLALALVLLVGAGLMVRSFVQLQHADIGIDPRHVLTFRVGLPPTQFKNKEHVRFFHDLVPRLRTISGVESAGVMHTLPSSDMYSFNAFRIEGRPEPKNLLAAPASMRRFASPGIFETLRIPLLRGRLFDENDTADAPRVAVVDRAFAEEIFPGEDAIGKHLLPPMLDPEDKEPPKVFTIVGIVGNVRQQVGHKRLPERCIWIPAAQEPDSFMYGVVRVQGDPLSYVRAVQAAVMATQADIPIYRVQSMEQVIARASWHPRFFSFLFAAFAGIALLLAAIGIYGVMAYAVTQRTGEIGIRMALGAQRTCVLRLIVGQGLRLIVIGLTLGGAGALVLTRLLSSQLYGVGAGDVPTFIFVSSLLALVAVLACLLPARRAMRIDPIEALREE